ncbi:PepSY domain-containing protein [Azonexus sp.]|uniref:PepSY-associated TM helix domain-containing protein n=1 Tax=Azonexus sp. TaxID=1872668 RepID=UPI0027BA4243|nr:PepSY-associated TM helix domain-containing protein [Azonexus sp.]
MRSNIIRAYKGVHTWTGILTGLALFIAFYAGALTMFEESLERWVAPPGRHAQTPLVQADALIAAALAARPEAAKQFTLHLAETAPLGRLTWQKGRDDAQPWSAELDAAGELQLVRLAPGGVAQFVDTLHRTAGIPGDHEIGETAMGIVSVVYVVALVSGLIVLLPSLIKDFFALRVGRNLKRMWLDAHNLLGITSFPFHLLIALTSVIFCLHDPIYALQDPLIYDGKFRQVTASSGVLAQAPKDPAAAPMLPVQALLDQVAELEPGFQPSAIEYRNAGTGGAVARVIGDDPRYLVRNVGFVVLGAVDGRILNTDYLPGHQGSWSAVVAAFFAVHFGTYGGETMRWVYFLLGLGGAFVFYSGNLLWLETRRRKAKAGELPAQARASRWLAAGTVGTCLGCIAGVSAMLVVGKWWPGVAPETVYYLVFLFCVAWAFIAGAPRAAVQLGWLTALATAALPATSLLAWLLPDSGLWWHAPAFGVDLVAAAGALMLAWAAVAAGRRARGGDADSVWAQPASSQPLPPSGRGPASACQE